MDAPGIILPQWGGFGHSFLFKSLISLPHGNRMKAQSLMWGNVKFWVLCIIYNKNLHSKKAFSLREVLTGLLFCTDLAEWVRKTWDGSDDLGIAEELLWFPWVHHFLGALQVTRRKSLWMVQIRALYSWLKATEESSVFKSLKIRVLALWDWWTHPTVLSPPFPDPWHVGK